MELSWETVSARLQPATASQARLVLSKTVLFFCTTLYIEKLTPMHSCLALSNGTVFFHNLFPARGRTHQPPTRPDRAWPERIKVLQMGFQMSWDPIRRTFIGQALSGRVDGWHDLHLSQRLCFGPRLEVARFLRNPVGNSSVSVRFVSTKRANGSFLFDYMGQWELLI